MRHISKLLDPGYDFSFQAGNPGLAGGLRAEIAKVLLVQASNFGLSAVAYEKSNAEQNK
jgi:hypothetical protein